MENIDTNENGEKLYSSSMGKVKLFIRRKENKYAHIYAWSR